MPTIAPFTPPVSDGQLVVACLAGQPGAVDAFFARFHARLVDHLRQHVTLGRDHDAEDLTQEAFYKALRALDRFDQTAPLWPWLRRIAENTARDHYRLARHRREVPEDVLDLYGLLPPGEDHAVRQAERDHVLRALGALPRRDREVIVEVDLKQLPQREAAAMFGISYVALRKRLGRAHAAFRRSYEATGSLPLFQWLTKLGGTKLATSGALGAGLSAAIPVLIIAGLTIGPIAHGQPRSHRPSLATTRVVQAEPHVSPGNDVTAQPAASAVSAVVPPAADGPEPQSGLPAGQAGRPAGAAAGVRAPEVAAPVGGVRTSNEFQDGPDFTTYSVRATDLDGSGPLEVSNDDEELEPVHAAMCETANGTTLTACRRG